MPDAAAKAFQELTAEFDAGQTIEAQVARDADKLETLLQAMYQIQGHDTAAWQETSIAALRTQTAKQLAKAISTADPQWWAAFAASYRELRASALSAAATYAAEPIFRSVSRRRLKSGIDIYRRAFGFPRLLADIVKTLPFGRPSQALTLLPGVDCGSGPAAYHGGCALAEEDSHLQLPAVSQLYA